MLYARFGNAFLDVIATEQPQREGAQGGTDQQRVEILDLRQRLAALPEHSVDDALLVETPQRRGQERRRP
jgi:hypothetical protein